MRQVLRSFHSHLNRGLLAMVLGSERLPDAFVFRLMEEERTVTTIVVHVDDIVCVGEKERCHHSGKDLGEMVPVNNLGQLR